MKLKKIHEEQISNISEQLILKKTKPNFPSIDIKEIENNTKLLENESFLIKSSKASFKLIKKNIGASKEIIHGILND